jgi:hypothetical protein
VIWLRLIVAAGTAVGCWRLAGWTWTQYKRLNDERRNPLALPRDASEAINNLVYWQMVGAFLFATFMLVLAAVGLPLAILSTG